MPYFVPIGRTFVTLALFLVIVILQCCGGVDVYPQVATSQGMIRGNAVGRSREGKEFYQFLGVPYALPPVGPLRFEAPQPMKPWTGVRMAARQQKPCLQFDFVTGFTTGSEDCLYLNVFVPKIGVMSRLRIDYGENWRNSSLLPVMVYIYGGGWMYGAADTYGPQYFMDEDVILVTFNHRLGALGFLNTGDGLVRGNMGLKDQNMVLRWIQDNIAQFGGDPSRVTLFGQSAGASAVHYHMLSPMSRGLFHRAISQSGTALRTNQFIERPVEQAYRLARQVNCPTDSTESIVNCLRKLDGNKIARVHAEILDAAMDPLALYAATQEVVIDGNTFLAKNPFDIVLSGDYYHVPWMTGMTSEDGLVRIAANALVLHHVQRQQRSVRGELARGNIAPFEFNNMCLEEIFKNRNLTNQINTNWNRVAPQLLNYNAHLVDVADRIRNFYLPGSGNVLSFTNNVKEFTDIFSDRYFFTATRYSALRHAKYAPTYMYYYTYPGEFTFFSIFVSSGRFPKILELGYNLATAWAKENLLGRRNRLGICHSDELAMLFPIRILSNVRKTDRDYPMSRAMVKSWVDFAANDLQNLRFQTQQWPPISPVEDSNFYMNLNTVNYGLIREPYTARAKFWESMNLVG